MPVNNAMRPPRSIATRMPLPASAVAAPRDANSPVPTIIAAVSSMAVIFPRLRLRVAERVDIGHQSTLAWLRRLRRNLRALAQLIGPTTNNRVAFFQRAEAL